MSRLKHAGSYFEIVECLRNIRAILEGVDHQDRMRFCKADYEHATKLLKKHKTLWSDDVFREVITITVDFFNINAFLHLPLAVIQDIFLWLPVDNYCKMSCVSREWRLICHSNEIWTMLYIKRFLRNNPGPTPKPSSLRTQMEAFQERLLDPQVGDKVEVAWRGKFRLETQDVYQGLAWWLAEVVDKNSMQGKYKIRYPGWDSRWDEWVPRSRLRWTVDRNTLAAIEVGDVVELWCYGANVPGAWLESKVRKIRSGKYCLGRVLSSGLLWVERDRLRLVRKASEADRRADSRHSISNHSYSTIGAMTSSVSETVRVTVANCVVM